MYNYAFFALLNNNDNDDYDDFKAQKWPQKSNKNPIFFLTLKDMMFFESLVFFRKNVADYPSGTLKDLIAYFLAKHFCSNKSSLYLGYCVRMTFI